MLYSMNDNNRGIQKLYKTTRARYTMPECLIENYSNPKLLANNQQLLVFNTDWFCKPNKIEAEEHAPSTRMGSEQQ